MHYISEALFSENSGDKLEFVIENPSVLDDGFWHTRLNIFFNDKKMSEKDLISVSQFGSLMSCISYLGNYIRGLEKDKKITLEKFGENMDSYIPLSKSQRKIWDE